MRSKILVRSIRWSSGDCRSGHSRRSEDGGASVRPASCCWPVERVHVAGQDVEHDIGEVDAVTERFGTGGFHRGQTVSQHHVEDVDHLPIAIVAAGKPAPDPLDCGRQHPVVRAHRYARHRVCEPAPAHSARDRRSSRRDRRIVDAPQRSFHPDGSRCGRHRPGPPDARRRWLRPSTCCCRSAPGRSSRPAPPKPSNPGSSVTRSDESRHSRRYNPSREALRTAGSRSRAALLSFAASNRSSSELHGPIFGSGCVPRSYRNSVA